MTQDVNAEQPEELNEYYKLELSQVFSRIDSLESFRLQIGTFVGTVNMTALAVALSAQKAGIIFMAAATLIVLIIIDMQSRRGLAACLYRGLQLRKKYAPGDPESLLHIVSGRTGEKVCEVFELADLQSRRAALRRIPVVSPSINGFWLPLSLAILEAAAGFALWLGYNWPLF